jgi:hypothetical protein
MRHNFLLIILLAMVATGCVSSRPFPHRTNFFSAAQLFPPDALVTQRGVLTVHGRQFTLNGYVAKSEAYGLRFIMTENFGGVLADVLVKPGGEVVVMQSKPPFRPAWIENYIAPDLKCIFGGTTETDCPVQMLSPTHFVVERRGYKLDLQTVGVKAGAQPSELFDPAKKGSP